MPNVMARPKVDPAMADAARFFGNILDAFGMRTAINGRTIEVFADPSCGEQAGRRIAIWKFFASRMKGMVTGEVLYGPGYVVMANFCGAELAFAKSLGQWEEQY